MCRSRTKKSRRPHDSATAAPVNTKSMVRDPRSSRSPGGLDIVAASIAAVAEVKRKGQPTLCWETCNRLDRPGNVLRGNRMVEHFLSVLSFFFFLFLIKVQEKLEQLSAPGLVRWAATWSDLLPVSRRNQSHTPSFPVFWQRHAMCAVFEPSFLSAGASAHLPVTFATVTGRSTLLCTSIERC